MKSKEELFKTKTFCMMPWVHMHVWPAGKTFPCCMADPNCDIGNTNEKSLLELWNSGRMKFIRKSMLNDRQIPDCRRCYELEESGMRTLRNSSLENFGHHFDKVLGTHDDGTVDELNMAYLDTPRRLQKSL